MSGSELEDRTLIKQLASGDTSALGELYRKYHKTVEFYARNGLGLSDLDVADIVQDVFKRVQQKAAQYRPTGKVRSWLRKITQHIVIDVIRQHLSRRRRETRYAIARPPQGGEVEAPSSPAWEVGDPVNAPGGLSGKDAPTVNGDSGEWYAVEAPSKFTVVPRAGGGSYFIWEGSFPPRVTKWGRTDRGRGWMHGGGADDVRGMFRCYGLVPEEGLKNR
jgi:RNA polymerase sigma factor (sigma-70 family)